MRSCFVFWNLLDDRTLFLWDILKLLFVNFELVLHCLHSNPCKHWWVNRGNIHYAQENRSQIAKTFLYFFSKLIGIIILYVLVDTGVFAPLIGLVFKLWNGGVSSVIKNAEISIVWTYCKKKYFTLNYYVGFTNKYPQIWWLGRGGEIWTKPRFCCYIQYLKNKNSEKLKHPSSLKNR